MYVNGDVQDFRVAFKRLLYAITYDIVRTILWSLGRGYVPWWTSLSHRQPEYVANDEFSHQSRIKILRYFSGNALFTAFAEMATLSKWQKPID